MRKEIYSASDVAQYIIETRQRDHNSPSHLALQKLLYFIQRDWMHENKAPLFGEDFQAWQFGPVIPGIYAEYKIYGSSPIWAHYDKPVNLPSKAKNFITTKINAYKSWSAGELVNATHRFGTAWSIIWDNGSGKGKIIPKDLIMKDASNVNG